MRNVFEGSGFLGRKLLQFCFVVGIEPLVVAFLLLSCFLYQLVFKLVNDDANFLLLQSIHFFFESFGLCHQLSFLALQLLFFFIRRLRNINRFGLFDWCLMNGDNRFFKFGLMVLIF